MAYLVLSRSLLTKSSDGGHADSQVVSTDVVNLGLFNQRPDLWLLQVLNLVFIGGSKVSAHAAVVTSDDNTTLAGGLGFIDTVFSVYTGFLTGLLEDITVLVFTDTTDIDNGLLREQILESRHI